ncbi:hypothetical protein TrRE_jg2907, partial [Triparma retinervis]
MGFKDVTNDAVINGLANNDLANKTTNGTVGSKHAPKDEVSSILKVPNYASLIRPLSPAYRRLSLKLMKSNLSTFDSYLSSFGTSLTSLTSPPPPNTLQPTPTEPAIQGSKSGKTSMYGVFVRRVVLGMEKRDFQQLVRGYEVTKEYFNESFSEVEREVSFKVKDMTIDDASTSTGSSSDMELDSKDVMQVLNRKISTGFTSSSPPLPPPGSFKASSLPTLSLLSSTSLPPLLLNACLKISSTTGRHPSLSTSAAVLSLSSLYPHTGLVHYLRYLNSLLHLNPADAEDSLHRYSDRAGLREQGCFAMAV